MCPKKLVPFKGLLYLLQRQYNFIKDSWLKDDYDKFNFDRPIKVFGNLPYNISTKILTSMIKLENLDKLFSNFIFVFQKEVADRIVAKYNTKEYGRLSILSTWKMKN